MSEIWIILVHGCGNIWIAISDGDKGVWCRPMNEITVIVPSFGHARYIAQTLESLLQQTRPASQIIVIDDHSPDRTDLAVAPYLDRIRYLQSPYRQGVGASVWRGVDMVETEYTYLIASDDWIEPRALEVLARFLDKDPHIGVVHGARTVVEDGGTRLSRSPIEGPYRLLDHAFDNDFVYAHPVILWRTQALRHDCRFRRFSLSLDWAHWIAAGLDGWDGYATHEMLGYYRRHASNTSRWTLPIVAEQSSLLRFVRRHFSQQLGSENQAKLRMALHQRIRLQGWLDLSEGRRRRAHRRFEAVLKFPDQRWNTILGLSAANMPTPWYRWLRGKRRAWLDRT